LNISFGAEDTPDYWVHVYSAQSNVSLPTIFFVSGFGANAPVFGYSDLLTRIASKGYIIVGVDRLSVPNYPKEASRFMDVLTWAKEGNLKTEMVKKGLTATPDLDRSTVMAQSAGNHIVHSEDLITPGKKLNFSTPAIILDTGLDPKGVRAFKSVACMPIQLGSPRWYRAWRGPIWHVNATAYGHVDCLYDVMISVAGLVCPSNSTTDKKLYRQHLADTSTLFIEAVFDHKTANLALLEDPSHFAVDVILEHDRKGAKDIEARCTNVPGLSEQVIV